MRSFPQRHGKPRAPKPEPTHWHHLLDLYARLVTARVPIDVEFAQFLRLRPAIEPAAAGWLVERSGGMLRSRIRLLQQLRWCGRRDALFADDFRSVTITGLEEAACALYSQLRSRDGQSPLHARETVQEALATLTRWQGSPRIRPLESVGEPLVRMKEFQGRLETDPTMANAPELDRLSATHSLPAEVIVRWRERLGEAEATALADVMGKEAPQDLRINTLKLSRAEALKSLTDKRIPAAATSLSPDGIRLGTRQHIHRLDIYTSGAAEIQDEGSQLASRCVDPHPGWRVLDACAGSGGKTLHLAALMKGRGEVYAHDIESAKLESLRLRARKADAQNVRVLEPGEAKVHQFDAVLIDAPCLGLGTLRRNPDLAWRGPVGERLTEMTARQRGCLADYARCVRPGGVLVYTTCSFEPEETTEVLAAALPEDFEPDPLGPVLQRAGILLSAGNHVLELRPSTHGTDGFFMARFRRRG